MLFVVLLVAFVLVARSVVVVPAAAVVLAVELAVCIVEVVVVVAEVAVVAGALCRDLVLRLLRKGSRTVVGTVSLVWAVLCQSLCHCVGLCPGLVAVRSRVG